jgi:ribosomal protein S18 acetylase RimI-like enzyme
MHITVATAEDAAVIAKLSETIHSLHCQLSPNYFQSASRETVVAELAKILVEKDTHALVAWENDAPIGYCVLKIIEREPNPWTCGFRRLLVDQLSVEAEWRRRGVGTRLMEAAFHFAREQEIQEVTLEYWANNDSAREFYKALGFAPLTEKVLINVADNNIDLQAFRSAEVIALTPEEQKELWDALNVTPNLSDAQRRLGATMRGET